MLRMATMVVNATEPPCATHAEARTALPRYESCRRFNEQARCAPRLRRPLTETFAVPDGTLLWNAWGTMIAGRLRPNSGGPIGYRLGERTYAGRGIITVCGLPRDPPGPANGLLTSLPGPAWLEH